jgi:low temperature requirement protein LtrA
MTRIRWRNTDAVPTGAVTPVELFFDVVFVFTLFAHIPLLLGIVAAAAGIHAAIAHPADRAQPPAAIALSGGVALFLLGVAEVRRTLRVGSPTSRLVAAIVVLGTIPIATTVSAGLHLAAVVAVVTAMLLIDARQRAGAGATYDLQAAS